VISPSYKETGGTSEQAAREIQGRAASLRNQLMSLFSRAFWLTPEDAADALGADILAIRPRFTELKQMGKIRKTDKTTTNAKGKTVRLWEFINPKMEQANLF